MPIYEYICPDCGTRFDALRLMREADAPIPCKHCEGQNAIRQVSVCFASSGGKSITSASSGGCSGCSGGSCASCGH